MLPFFSLFSLKSWSNFSFQDFHFSQCSKMYECPKCKEKIGPRIMVILKRLGYTPIFLSVYTRSLFVLLTEALSVAFAIYTIDAYNLLLHELFVERGVSFPLSTYRKQFLLSTSDPKWKLFTLVSQIEIVETGNESLHRTIWSSQRSRIYKRKYTKNKKSFFSFNCCIGNSILNYLRVYQAQRLPFRFPFFNFLISLKMKSILKMYRTANSAFCIMKGESEITYKSLFFVLNNA